MKINWFPGHMAKSLRELGVEIKNVDAVIYVLDARAPLDCINPELNKLIGTRPVLYVLNKIDLADEPKIDKLLSSGVFQSQSSRAIKMNCTSSGAGKIVVKELKALCEQKIKKAEGKGLNAFIKAMVVGVPNSGKSTLVNNLCGKAKAITGDKAGVTRGKQWVNVGENIHLLDTPGTLYPNLENQGSALRLALLGSIRNEVLDFGELAVGLIKELRKLKPEALKARYGVDDEGEPYEVIEKIAEARKLKSKGGEVDYDRASAMMIDDFRKGRLGKISWTTTA